MDHNLILGIESSCDETAAAVVRAGREVLSNVVASQMALHASYGGVVPELASREHLRNIVPVVREAIKRAGIGFGDLSAIAVTEGPGLAGALLVGITFAKALAFGCGKPLIAVNHLDGHTHAVLMDSGAALEGPLLALVVSGGHTHLFVAEQQLALSEQDVERIGIWNYRNVGRTVDDAAGEAFDKVAKLLGLGYPGGPWIDRLAKFGNPQAVPFTFREIRTRSEKQATPDATETVARFDFSFSGIKTAVLRYVEKHGMLAGAAARRAALASAPEMTATEVAQLCDGRTLDLIASFQAAVVGSLLRQSFQAAEAFGAEAILISGGVAANRELRARFATEGTQRGIQVAFPSPAMSTDNAAMIAAAAWPRFVTGEFAGDGMTAIPSLRLG